MSGGNSGRLALRGDGAVERGCLGLAQELTFEFAKGDVRNIVDRLVGSIGQPRTQCTSYLRVEREYGGFRVSEDMY